MWIVAASAISMWLKMAWYDNPLSARHDYSRFIFVLLADQITDIANEVSV